MGKRDQVTIGAHAAGVTFINVYEVLPERQDELVGLLSRAVDEVFSTLPGFVSTSIHASHDGKRVVNYTQWMSTDSFVATGQHPEAQARIQAFAAAATAVAPALFRVCSVKAG